MTRREGVVFMIVGAILIIFGNLGWRTAFGTVLIIAGATIVRRARHVDDESPDS